MLDLTKKHFTREPFKNFFNIELKMTPLANSKIITFSLKEKNIFRILIKRKVSAFGSFMHLGRFKYLLENFKIIATNY
jgi:hypothetical protein